MKYLESYNACYSCKGKVVATGSVGECGRCGIMQKIEKCSTSTTAKIDVEVDGAIHCFHLSWKMCVVVKLVKLICSLVHPLMLSLIIKMLPCL